MSYVAPRSLRALARLLLPAALVCATRPAAAQVIPEPDDDGPSESASAAYVALTFTPVGALPPSADFMLARPGTGPRPLRLHGRFGSIDRGTGVEQRAFAATLDMPVAALALSLTGGWVDIACDELPADPDFSFDCKGGLTLGARLGSSLFSRSLDAAGTTALVVGAEVTAGYADVKVVEGQAFDFVIDASVSALTATVAAPIALTIRTGNAVVAPMIVPRFGYGRAEADLGALSGVAGDGESRAGGRFMLGGGVAVRFGERLGFDAGLHKVFIDEGDLAIGLGASIGF